MQTVPEVVYRQLYGISVQNHSSLVDAVGITSDRSAEITWDINVIVNVVES